MLSTAITAECYIGRRNTIFNRKVVRTVRLCKLADYEICLISNQESLEKIEKELTEVHPKNIIMPQPVDFVGQGQVELPIYRIELEYDILKNSHLNHRWTTKYIILPQQDEESLDEFYDYWLDMACNDFIAEHHYRLKELHVLSEKHICNVTLKIA